MKESKDFRSGTRLLQWEKEKLSMEYEDLQMKWTEIQQTKVKQLIKDTIEVIVIKVTILFCFDLI